MVAQTHIQQYIKINLIPETSSLFVVFEVKLFPRCFLNQVLLKKYFVHFSKAQSKNISKYRLKHVSVSPCWNKRIEFSSNSISHEVHDMHFKQISWLACKITLLTLEKNKFLQNVIWKKIDFRWMVLFNLYLNVSFWGYQKLSKILNLPLAITFQIIEKSLLERFEFNCMWKISTCFLKHPLLWTYI